MGIPFPRKVGVFFLLLLPKWRRLLKLFPPLLQLTEWWQFFFSSPQWWIESPLLLSSWMEASLPLPRGPVFFSCRCAGPFFFMFFNGGKVILSSPFLPRRCRFETPFFPFFSLFPPSIAHEANSVVLFPPFPPHLPLGFFHGSRPGFSWSRLLPLPLFFFFPPPPRLLISRKYPDRPFSPSSNAVLIFLFFSLPFPPPLPRCLELFSFPNDAKLFMRSPSLSPPGAGAGLFPFSPFPPN